MTTMSQTIRGQNILFESILRRSILFYVVKNETIQ